MQHFCNKVGRIIPTNNSCHVLNNRKNYCPHFVEMGNKTIDDLLKELV